MNLVYFFFCKSRLVRVVRYLKVYVKSKNRANGCGSHKGSNQLCDIFWENFSKRYFIDPEKKKIFSPPFCSSTGTTVVSLGETGLFSFMGFVVQWLLLIGQGLIFRARSTNGASGSHTREFWVKRVVLVYGFCKQRLIRSLMELLVHVRQSFQ